MQTYWTENKEGDNVVEKKDEKKEKKCRGQAFAWKQQDERGREWLREAGAANAEIQGALIPLCQGPLSPQAAPSRLISPVLEGK